MNLQGGMIFYVQTFTSNIKVPAIRRLDNEILIKQKFKLKIANFKFLKFVVQRHFEEKKLVIYYIDYGLNNTTELSMLHTRNIT